VKKCGGSRVVGILALQKGVNNRSDRETLKDRKKVREREREKERKIP
jgi:hypothetical protein